MMSPSITCPLPPQATEQAPACIPMRQARGVSTAHRTATSHRPPRPCTIRAAQQTAARSSMSKVRSLLAMLRACCRAGSLSGRDKVCLLAKMPMQASETMFLRVEPEGGSGNLQACVHALHVHCLSRPHADLPKPACAFMCIRICPGQGRHASQALLMLFDLTSAWRLGCRQRAQVFIRKAGAA